MFEPSYMNQEAEFPSAPVGTGTCPHGWLRPVATRTPSRPSVAFAHRDHAVLAPEEGAAQVDRVDGVPVLEARVVESLLDRHSRVVVEDVERAELVDAAPDRRAPVVLRSDVTLVED